MLLEHSCGQLFQRGDIGVFAGINKRLYGVGLASVFSAFGINIYYTYLISIACCYFVMSFTSPMPWSIQRTKSYQDVYCDSVTNMDRVMNRVCPEPQKCDPREMYITEEYFLKDLVHVYQYVESTGKCELYDTSINIAASENQYTQFSMKIFIGLCITWFLTYFCVYKGVKSSSFVVWITVPIPIGFIFIMVLNGLCLPNSDEGIRMYLRGEVDGVVPDALEKLKDGQMWADACGQIFFSLGVVMGIMTSYSSYNRRNKPIIRDVMAISFGNCGTSFFSGFAVFSIIGYLKWLDSPVASKTSSSSLAFVAFPAATETMTGSNFWAGILGLTLFMLGIDSAFSMVEAMATVIYDTNWGA